MCASKSLSVTKSKELKVKRGIHSACLFAGRQTKCTVPLQPYCPCIQIYMYIHSVHVYNTCTCVAMLCPTGEGLVVYTR